MRPTVLSLAALFTVTVAAVAFADSPPAAPTFGDDVQFLQSHDKKPIVLSDGKAMIVISPELQGRVVTSTSGGNDGPSYGWINRELIASGEVRKHINAYGGEDRLWLGPEGGQFSIFFAPKAPFDLEHWFTPAAFDTEPFQAEVHDSPRKAYFVKDLHPTNYSGTKFDIRIRRQIELLGTAEIWADLQIDPIDGIGIVGFESKNSLVNIGKEPWKKETGLLSLWSMGMFNASPSTTVIVPIKTGPESELGIPVTSDYFGQVPPDRLKVKDDVAFFKADAKYRSKIGIGPRRAKPIFGSYDAERHVLTLIQYKLPAGETDYVNSAWKIQDNPYAGDVVNSYNDGPPPTGGKQLGQFYELETSSPAAALAPGKTITHTHRTIHFQGPADLLDKISLAALGIHVSDIPTTAAH